jgi:signal transduction histidine kinase
MKQSRDFSDKGVLTTRARRRMIPLIRCPIPARVKNFLQGMGKPYPRGSLARWICGGQTLMSKKVAVAALLLIIIGAFVAGRYTVEPRLGPLYEGEDPMAKLQLRSGTGAISPARNQLIGVNVESVERNSGLRMIRTTGRVVEEDNRVYRLMAATVGRQDPRMLLLQRSDPLQAVVDSVRKRNLGISALLLVLLAINMSLVIVASSRAQSLAKLKMDFVASISHELRTPLSVIFSAGENIRDGFVSGESNLTHYGSIVTGQARQLMDLVDRILFFASIHSGKYQYNLRPLQVSEIFQRVRRTTAGLMIEEDACNVKEQMEPDLPCVLGDLSAVCGCLENLITNAIKFSGRDHCICVSATLHEIDNHRKEIWFGVEDHGIGISSSELQHIFEPFYRSPEVAAAQIHGTGLGLSLAKRLAKVMGGRISVTSEVGVGSVFTLHLAAAREGATSTGAPNCSMRQFVPGEHVQLL